MTRVSAIQTVKQLKKQSYNFLYLMCRSIILFSFSCSVFFSCSNKYSTIIYNVTETKEADNYDIKYRYKNNSYQLMKDSVFFKWSEIDSNRISIYQDYTRVKGSNYILMKNIYNLDAPFLPLNFGDTLKRHSGSYYDTTFSASSEKIILIKDTIINSIKCKKYAFKKDFPRNRKQTNYRYYSTTGYKLIRSEFKKFNRIGRGWSYYVYEYDKELQSKCNPCDSVLKLSNKDAIKLKSFIVKDFNKLAKKIEKNINKK